MKRIKVPLCLLAAVLLAALAAAGCLIGGGRARANRAVSAQMLRTERKLQKKWAADTKRIAGENFYQKLRSGDPVSILIIGDGIAQSQGSTQGMGWDEQLTRMIEKTSSSAVQITKISGSHIAESWINYTRRQNSQNDGGQAYDCVFLFNGVNDQHIITYKQFHMFYENLIDRLIRTNPRIVIFPVLENSLQVPSNFSANIYELAEYYGFDLIDERSAFAQTGAGSQKLVQSDGVTPDDAGYSLYAKGIYAIISRQISQSKTVSYSGRESFFSNSVFLDRCRFISKPDAVKGFAYADGCYSADKPGDTLTFQTGPGEVFIDYHTDPAGGKFQVLIDHSPAATVDTKSTASDDLVEEISGLSSGRHQVVIKVSSAGNISINGIVANK